MASFARRIGVYVHDIVQPASEFNVVLGTALATGKTSNTHLYRLVGCEINPRNQGRIPMTFKPNYGRDRAERGRAARARSEEKQRKKDEKTAQRKAERAAAESPPDDKQD